jgi:hypothetical protein
MKPLTLFQVFAGGWVLAGAISGVVHAQPQTPAPVTFEPHSFEFVAADSFFQSLGSDSQAVDQTRVRLDPQQRAKFREAQRQAMADSHYGVADALQLDAATFDKLMELLADQQMEQSGFFHELFAGKVSRNPADQLRDKVERVTREVDALRDLLGQEKLERYQKLRSSVGLRGQIRELDQRLGASDKLSGAQRERLVELLNEHLVGSMEQHMLNSQRSLFDFSSTQEPERNWQLQTIELNEAIWRETPASNRRLRERAAEFLTEPQLAMLTQLHAEHAARLQQHIEQMRVHAGLNATIPEQPEIIEVPPATVHRDVKLSIKAAVNSENPRYLTTVVSSGNAVSLKIADGLFLEATPIGFENDACNLRLQYFEMGVTGKRLIENTVAQASKDEHSLAFVGGGISVLTGSKGYAVELSVLVEAT